MEETSADCVYTTREFDILNDVYKLLVDGNVLGTPDCDEVVDFKFPNELKVSWDRTEE